MALYVHIGGKRRRSGVDRRVAAIMSKFDRQTAESDERFLAFEEKPMKLEADGRKEERPGGGTDDENAANVCSADATNDASTADKIPSTIPTVSYL